MLTNIAKKYQGITVPLLTFWLLCTSMVFCAMSMESNSHVGGHHSASSVHSSQNHHHAHDQQLSENSRYAKAHHHSHIMHADSSVQSSESAFSSAEKNTSDIEAMTCCDENQPVANISLQASSDLPISAVLIIVLIFSTQLSVRFIRTTFLRRPSWAPPPIPVLNCSFLK